MRRWLPLLAVLALAGCAGTPKKAQDSTGMTVAGKHAAGATSALPPGCSGTSPYAAAQEDPSTRGDYKAGGLYKPGVKDTTPDYVPNVDCIPEPHVVDEPRSPVGNRSPYTVLGKQYHVMDTPGGYVEQGTSSYYGAKFHGRRTSNQEVYDMYAFTAAHKTLPLPSFARVTNLDNGKSVVVRVNDRGPFHDGRVIDLSYAAAVKLGIVARGTGRVEVRALTSAEADAPVSFAGTAPVTDRAAGPPPQATAASLPITCAHTITVASGITGLTLPGMIELPGCSAGSSISPRPASGPEFIQRRSLAILIRATASALSWPDSSTASSCAAMPSNLSLADSKVVRVSFDSSRAIFRPNCGWALIPVPTAVPP